MRPLYDKAARNEIDQASLQVASMACALPHVPRGHAIWARAVPVPARGLAHHAPSSQSALCRWPRLTAANGVAAPYRAPHNASPPASQYALQSLLDSYGTHVVSTVYWGGLGECLPDGCPLQRRREGEEDGQGSSLPLHVLAFSAHVSSSLDLCA